MCHPFLNPVQNLVLVDLAFSCSWSSLDRQSPKTSLDDFLPLCLIFAPEALIPGNPHAELSYLGV